MSKQRDATEELLSWRRTLQHPAVKAILRSGRGRSFDKEIDAACKAFELDPAVKKDREILLGIFAFVHFGPPPGLLGTGPALPQRKPRGRPKLSIVSKVDREVLEQAAIIHKVTGLRLTKALKEAINIAVRKGKLAHADRTTDPKRLKRALERISGHRFKDF